MKWTCFFLFILNINLLGQIDSNYIELSDRDKTVQLHLTTQDFALRSNAIDGNELLFRINNLSTGFYFKLGVSQLFVSLPVAAFDNRSLGAPRSLGTGFSLNTYLRKLHINYTFKYSQGYESLDQILSDGLNTLSKYNYFFFNRLNTHYIFNPEKFSLQAAMRFTNRQKRSAGSFLAGLPTSYHFGKIDNTILDRFGRFSIGPMIGYGHTFVSGPFGLSLIGKSGLDFRYTTFQNRNDYNLRPSVNLILSAVYDVETYFCGIIYNYYPEFDYNSDQSLEIVNWKLRLYVGKRFK